MGYIPPRHQRLAVKTPDDLINEVGRARSLYLWSDDYYAQRCRDNRNERRQIWRWVNNLALGIAVGTIIGTGGINAWLIIPLLLYLPVVLVQAYLSLLPPDWRGFW
jgi:hypothetical protein